MGKRWFFIGITFGMLLGQMAVAVSTWHTALRLVVRITLGLSLFGVILHWKIRPYADRIGHIYKKVYDVFDKKFKYIDSVLSKIPNLSLGNHIQLSSSYELIIILLITILIIF